MTTLTSFIQRPEIRGRLKEFRPPKPKKLPQLLLPGETDHASLVGTALDYLLRFELERLAPHASRGTWVAEYGATHPGLSRIVADRAECALEEAKAALAVYLNTATPTCQERTAMAEHALRLAKLDGAFFTGDLDPGFAIVDQSDVRDLVNLLSIVPFDQLVHETTMLLGYWRRMKTGHDNPRVTVSPCCDLITGGLLVDFKTTSKNPLAGYHLDQILAYFILVLKYREYDPSFPEIDRLGLYYCRHGYLWFEPITTWTRRPGFGELRDWFWEVAGVSASPAKRGIIPRLLSRLVQFVRGRFQRRGRGIRVQ